MLDALTLLPLATQGSKFSGRTDDITRAIAALVQADRQARPRVLWQRLADQRGWRIAPEAHGDEARLCDAEGHERLTYTQFVKRLARAKKRRPALA